MKNIILHIKCLLYDVHRRIAFRNVLYGIRSISAQCPATIIIMSRAVSQDDDDSSEREPLSVARVTWRAEESSDPGPCHGPATEEVFPPQGCVRCGLYKCTVLYTHCTHDIAPGCLGSWM